MDNMPKLTEESKVEQCLADGHSYRCAIDQAALNRPCSCDIKYLGKSCAHCGKKITDVNYAPFCSYQCQSYSNLNNARKQIQRLKECELFYE